MNFAKTLFATFLVGTATCAFASGFGLYEPSAISHAMGGSLVGKAMDGSANVNNPATLTDLTNIVVSMGFVTEHPRGDVKVNGKRYEMDPGPFILPNLQLVAPLPYDFTFGLSVSPEYGLGTEFSKNWAMNWSTLETTVEGLVINPNLAYKITDKWSVGAGIRWLYFSFEQSSHPYLAYPGVGYAGDADLHLKGDNGWSDFGWQIGTKYDIFDNLSVGLVYKSAIDVTVKGHSTASNVTPYPGCPIPGMAYGLANAVTGDAEADLTLPQSIIGGINWDVTEKWHIGAAVSWTQWSEIDTLLFNLNGNPQPKRLSWHDTWRTSFGVAYDFADDWTFMISYIFDMDCTDEHQTSAMLPPADRHILSGGITWRCWGGLEMTLSYSCVFMDGGIMQTQDVLGRDYTLKTDEGFCHAGGFSVTYRF